MTLSSQSALIGLWIGAMLAEGTLLALLVGRRAYRQYPAFTAFIAFCVIRSFVLFYVAYHASSLYETVMWVAYAPQLVLLLMLVLEVFHFVFYPYETLPKGTLAHFIEATTAFAAIVIVFAIRYPGAQPTAWMTFARAMDQATSWVLCAIFAFIALFSSYFGIPWRHRVYGVGIGFLFYLSVEVAVTTVIAQYGIQASRIIWPVGMLAFLVTCIIWTYYFATAEVARVVPTVEQLNRVHAALARLAVSIDGHWDSRKWALKNQSDEPRWRDADPSETQAELVVLSVKDVRNV